MADTDDRLASLVPRAVDGNARALKEIIRIVYPQVLRYCRARVGGGRQPTAEDIAQETCLALSKSIHKYVDMGRPFMAYVYGIAFNKVTDAHRAMGRDRSSPVEEMPDRADPAYSPEEIALVEDGSNRARALLDTLSERAREIIILRVFVGLSADDTADVVGSTPGAVRVAQHRALSQLRKRVEREASGGGVTARAGARKERR